MSTWDANSACRPGGIPFGRGFGAIGGPWAPVAMRASTSQRRVRPVRSADTFGGYLFSCAKKGTKNALKRWRIPLGNHTGSGFRTLAGALLEPGRIQGGLGLRPGVARTDSTTSTRIQAWRKAPTLTLGAVISICFHGKTKSAASKSYRSRAGYCNTLPKTPPNPTEWERRHKQNSVKPPARVAPAPEPRGFKSDFGSFCRD